MAPREGVFVNWVDLHFTIYRGSKTIPETHNYRMQYRPMVTCCDDVVMCDVVMCVFSSGVLVLWRVVIVALRPHLFLSLIDSLSHTALTHYPLARSI